jgi:hypothetical protein
MPAVLARRDRLWLAAIVGSGTLCFALLAWTHLGLGAWVSPPPVTAREQVASTGIYVVTLHLESGQLTAAGPNQVGFIVRDRTGHALDGVAVRVQPEMTTMPMDVPAVSVHPEGGGRYSAQPVFGMAGAWRLEVRISAAGHPTEQASFDIGVRWS